MVKACACVDELTATFPISPAVEEVNFSEFLISEDEHRVIKKLGGRCVCSSWNNHAESVSVEVDHRPLKHTDVMKKEVREGIKLLPKTKNPCTGYLFCNFTSCAYIYVKDDFWGLTGAATRYCLVQYELKGFPVNTEPLTFSVVDLWWIYKYHPPNQSPNHG